MAEWIFLLLGFLTSNLGLLITGALSALMILLWDWRFALGGVLFIQLSAATSAVVLHNVPAEWALVQTVIMGMVCLMLFLSARAHGLRPAPRQTGTWVSRGLVLGMFLVGAWFMELQVALPGMDPLVTELFIWLVLCGLMLLGLSDHPLYNGVGMMLWLIPVQVLITVITPIPVIVAFVGLVILLLGMALSYLVFVEHMPAEERAPVLTDLAFPQQVRLERPPVPPDVDGASPEDVRGYGGAWGAAGARFVAALPGPLAGRIRPQDRNAPAPSAPQADSPRTEGPVEQNNETHAEDRGRTRRGNPMVARRRP